MHFKDKLQYVDPSGFEPLPKYGHMSEKIPEYAAAESAIAAAYAKVWECPDIPSARIVAGNADAAIPSGGPDRYHHVVTEFLHFPARDGTLIELKVYKSPNVKPNATLMYRMHGSGWCVGSHEVDGAENVYAAVNPNIVVVSVGYRKAPEHPFPQPFHDSYDGLLWCKQNSETLGVNPERIIVSGSSAGANLTAAVTLEARRQGLTGILAQVLHFPSVCHPKFFPVEKYELGSTIQNMDNPVLSTQLYELMLDMHVPNAEPDELHSPLLAKSHKDLPPALIQCAGYDPLRDEAFAYADKLRADGVEVEMHGYSGVPHCFPEIFHDIAQTADFYKRYTNFLQKYAVE